MPYERSTQSVGFRNRPVPEQAQGQNRLVSDLEQNRSESVKDMQRQASGQITELQRIDTLATKKDKYELDNLRQFSKTLDSFLDSASKNVAKPYIASERRKGVDLARRAAAGDQEALAQLGRSKEQLAELEKKVLEHQQKTDRVLDKAELDAYRLTLQEKIRLQNIRKMNSNVRWGFLRGQLIEGVKGTKSWITNQLATSDENITLSLKQDDGSYKSVTVNIQDYHDAKDLSIRNGIITHLEDKYIETFNPDGLLNQDVVTNYLTTGVVKAVDEMQADDEKRFAIKLGNERNDNAIGQLTIAVEAFETGDQNSYEAVKNQLQNYITSRPSYLRQMGITGNEGTSTKEWIVSDLPKILASIKNDTVRNRLINKLREENFVIPGQPPRTLEEQFPGLVNFDVIAADADTAQNEIFKQTQLNNKANFKSGVALAQDNWLNGGSEQDYKDKIAQLTAEWHYVGNETDVDAAMKFKPKPMTKERSESFVRSILAEKSYLTRDQARWLHPDIREALNEKKLIKENDFGSNNKFDENTRTSAHASITNAVIASRTGKDEDKLTKPTTADLIIAAHAQNEMMTLAESIFDAANNGIYVDADGVSHNITSHSQALVLATKIIRKRITDGKNEPGNIYEVNSLGQWVSQQFVGSDINVNNTESTQRIETGHVRNYENTLTNSGGKDLLLNKNNTAFIPDSHLEISEDPLNGPIFKSKYLNQIKLLDAQYNGRGRDIFEIVNTIRASRGMKALEVPPELQTLREQKGLTKTIKANIALARAIGNGKAEEIEVDNAGLVSINRLENAFTSTNFTAFGLNPTNPNFDIILQGAGVTREQFNTDPNAASKVLRYHTNDIMTKAAALTNNKQEMIRLSAVGLRFGEGAMSEINTNQEYSDYGHAVQRSYMSGAPIEGERFIAAINPDTDIFTTTYGTTNIEQVLPVRVQTILNEPIAINLEGLNAQLKALDEQGSITLQETGIDKLPKVWVQEDPGLLYRMLA